MLSLRLYSFTWNRNFSCCRMCVCSTLCGTVFDTWNNFFFHFSDCLFFLISILATFRIQNDLWFERFYLKRNRLEWLVIFASFPGLEHHFDRNLSRSEMKNRIIPWIYPASEENIVVVQSLAESHRPFYCTPLFKCQMCVSENTSLQSFASYIHTDNSDRNVMWSVNTCVCLSVSACIRWWRDHIPSKCHIVMSIPTAFSQRMWFDVRGNSVWTLFHSHYHFHLHSFTYLHSIQLIGRREKKPARKQ